MLLKWLKYLGRGIGWGCTSFVFINLAGYLVAGPAFLELIVRDYPRQALGAMLVGVCCGTSSIVYTFEKLALWQHIAIHAAVGLSGYFLTAYHLGWMPVQNAGYVAAFVVCGILVFAVIWACFYLYNRYEAKKLNERLKELAEPDGPKP